MVKAGLMLVAVLVAVLFFGIATGKLVIPGSQTNTPPVPVAPTFAIDAAKVPVDVTTMAGVSRGYTGDAVDIFKGLPYAAPPIGDLRWRAPIPVEPWTGIRAAQSFGYDCMQNRVEWDTSMSQMAMSEDCLTLNVWRPQTPDGLLPVMVWIHGGGFVMGSSSQWGFDGAALARRGVVLVTFNYRLGRFGFFAHPLLTAEAAGAPTGNFGLMDQIAALRWVRENIAAFGGDPANVAIFGESAGGASVAHLMSIEDARGLFHKAIIQSGGGRLGWTPFGGEGEDPGAEAAGEAFARSVQGGADTVAALRALPAQTVLGKVSFDKLRSKDYSGPMIDGVLVKTEFLESFARGREAVMPMIVGANSAELDHMSAVARFFIRRAIKKGLEPGIGEIKQAYGDSSTMNDRIIDDWGFIEPSRSLARRHAAIGARAYLYQFDYVQESLRDKFRGAPHSSEVAFVFGTLGTHGRPVSESDRRVAAQIGDYWTGFARSGAPVAGGLPEWPAYDGSTDTRMTFETAGPRMEKVPAAAPLDAITRASDGEFK
jgi:para-nitrobenzyl esterase